MRDYRGNAVRPTIQPQSARYADARLDARGRDSTGLHIARAAQDTREAPCREWRNDKQIMSILGHSDIAHAELYTKEAEQKKRAADGMNALRRAEKSRRGVG